MSIRVLVGDDHKIVCEGIRSLLEKESDIDVIGEADDGRTTVRLAKELSPDVVVMDISMPDLNGIEATSQIIADSRATKVIGLSMHSDKRFVLGMMSAGASGYLLKDCAFEDLVRAIHTVVTSGTYLSPRVADVIVKDHIHYLQRNQPFVYAALTTRQREVLQLLAEGKTVKEIAVELCLSVKTIETHRQEIMHRLNVRSIAELTKYAIREGFTSLQF